MIMLSVATSLDAMAVGLTFAFYLLMYGKLPL